MASRRTGLQATPPQVSSEVYQFLDQLKRRVEQLDEQLQATAVNAALALRYTPYGTGVYDNGVISSGVFAPSAGNGMLQKYINNGAHTITPPRDSCILLIHIHWGVSGAAITAEGFDAELNSNISHAHHADHKALARIMVLDDNSIIEWLELD